MKGFTTLQYMGEITSKNGRKPWIPMGRWCFNRCRLVEDWDGVVFVRVIGYPKPMSPQWPREGGQNSKFFGWVGLEFWRKYQPTSFSRPKNNWLVVSTHLQNISQNGNLPQVGVKIKNI